MAITVKLTRRKTPAGIRIAQTLGAINASYTKVGFPQGDPKAQRLAGEISNASLAAIHNFGSPSQGIPARPFMTSVINDGVVRSKLRILQVGLLKRIYAGAIAPKPALMTIGEYMIGAIKDSIRNGSWVSNKDSTIARKGSSKPLIDTAQMINSVAQKVVMRGGV